MGPTSRQRLNRGNAALHASSLLKFKTLADFKENYWFPRSGIPGALRSVHPFRNVFSCFKNPSRIEKVHIADDTESRQKFLSNPNWTHSMLEKDEIVRKEHSSSNSTTSLHDANMTLA